MIPRTRTLRGATLAVIACTAFLLASCSSNVTPRAIPADDPTTASNSTTVATPPLSQQGADTGGDVDLDVEIGDCVELGGTQFEASIDEAKCGSSDSNYRVVGKAPTSDECISDADQYYYETVRDIEQGALCLDVDWVIDGCMELSGEDPLRVECDSPGQYTVRVVEIRSDTADIDACTGASDSGFEYDERNFIVCVEEL